MADVSLTTDTRPDRAFVRLRIAMQGAEASARVLALPREPMTTRSGEPTALWVALDQWLLVSSAPADELIARIEDALAGTVHNATDATDALGCFVLAGRHARGLLAMGSGIDFDNKTFPPGRCVRTRFAKLAVLIHAVAADRFELFFDCSAAHYLEQWLRRAMTDAGA